MLIDNLTTFVALVLAISLASERLVTIIKTLFPSLADEAKTEAQEVDLDKDRWRRFGVQFIAFICAWLTSVFLAVGVKDPSTYFSNLFGSVEFGDQDTKVPVLILGLLASGGSAFWTNILGYTKAVKDIRIQERATASMKYHILATTVNKTAIGSGQVADASRKINIANGATNYSKTTLDNGPDRVASIQINI